MVLHQPKELRIDLPLQAVATICARHDVTALWAFGSVLRADFGAASDIDFIARFRNDDTGPWMTKLQQLETDLHDALGRKIDIVTRRGVERSANHYRRQHILQSARLVYEQG